MYISDSKTLSDFCAEAKKSALCAVDTEFLREKTYYPKLCLVQLATHERSAVVDPLQIEDLSALAELLEDKSTVKVFHAATQDIEVLYDELGCIASPLFDTQIAAAFLGLRQQIGYGALVEEICKVRLPKAEALSDWSRRPLDKEQLAYAEDDVFYLPRIYDEMHERLLADKRLDWALPEMDMLAKKVLMQRDPAFAYTHLKRASSLTRKQLAVAREICIWRENLASKRNIPRRWVLSDETVVELCRRLPSDLEGLHRMRNTDQLSESDAVGLVRAIARGKNTPPSAYPHTKRRERTSVSLEGVLDLMVALVRIIADKNNIAPQLLATRDDLLSFLTNRDTSEINIGWRRNLLFDPLCALLDGQLGLTVKNAKVELL